MNREQAKAVVASYDLIKAFSEGRMIRRTLIRIPEGYVKEISLDDLGRSPDSFEVAPQKITLYVNIRASNLTVMKAYLTEEAAARDITDPLSTTVKVTGVIE